MEKNTLISWVVVIVLVALGAFMFMRGNNNKLPGDTKAEQDPNGNRGIMEDGVITEEKNTANEKEVMKENVVVVNYSDEGFSPKEVTINKGDVVRFVNNASGGMWVGSAIHPTHSQYPIKTDSDCLGSAFDQCVASDPGTSWEFKFDAVGTHGYHNHVRASHFGKVIVK